MLHSASTSGRKLHMRIWKNDFGLSELGEELDGKVEPKISLSLHVTKLICAISPIDVSSIDLGNDVNGPHIELRL